MNTRNDCNNDVSKERVLFGFPELDELISGLHGGELILVAARPCMGKTTFALKIAANVATKHQNVAFFSLEISKQLLVQRILCFQGSIDSKKLCKGELDKNDWSNLVNVANKVADASLYIDDTVGITVMSLSNKARRLKEENGLDLIIIDYLQLMKGDTVEGTALGNLQQVFSDIFSSLKSVARELNVPIIVLSQLSRRVEQRPQKRPELSDLREWGDLELEADIIMFMYREEFYFPETENQKITEINVAKNLRGFLGTVNLLI